MRRRCARSSRKRRSRYYDAKAKLTASQKRQVDHRQASCARPNSPWLASTPRSARSRPPVTRAASWASSTASSPTRPAPRRRCCRAPRSPTTWCGATTSSSGSTARPATRRSSNANYSKPSWRSRPSSSPSSTSRSATAEKALAAVGGMVSSGYNGPGAGGPAGTAQRRRRPGRGSVLDQRPDRRVAASRPGCTTRSTRRGWPASPGIVHCWRTQSWGRASAGPGLRLLRHAERVRRHGDTVEQDLRRPARRVVHAQRRGARGALRHLVPTDLDPRPPAGARTPAAATRPARTRTTYTYPCFDPPTFALIKGIIGANRASKRIVCP